MILYFGSGIGASLFWGLKYPTLPVLGASGAILGVIGILIILMPGLKVFLFFFIPMPLWGAGIAIVVIDFFNFIPDIAGHLHLAGMAYGLLYGLYLRKKKR